MSQLPHLVIDGALVAASLLGSEHVVFALDEHARGAARAVAAGARRARRARRRGAPGGIGGGRFRSGYLTGQETALVNALDSGRSRPPGDAAVSVRARPRRAADAGLERRDVRAAGAGRALRRRLVPRARNRPATGHQARDRQRRRDLPRRASRSPAAPRVRQLLGASGGLAEPLQGVLLGGYAGTWLGPEPPTCGSTPMLLRERGAQLGRRHRLRAARVGLRRRRGRERRPLAAARERRPVRALHPRPQADRRRARGALRRGRPPRRLCAYRALVRAGDRARRLCAARRCGELRHQRACTDLPATVRRPRPPRRLRRLPRAPHTADRLPATLRVAA